MPRELSILLIEDSRADALIIDRALRECSPAPALRILADGYHALDYLRTIRDGAGPWPDLILLDLNLPGLDGCQILTEIRADAALRSLPVVILTTSGRDEDIDQSYRAGASSVIQKPTEYPAYRELAAVILKYWGEVVSHPERSRR